VRGVGLPGAMAGGARPAGVLFLRFHFGARAAAVAVVTRLILKRPALSLFGRLDRVLPDFLAVAVIAAAVAALALTAAVFTLDITWKIAPATWLLFIPLALPLILLQTGAEEVVFRGYLLQQLGARFGVAARTAWLMVPSLIFALAHSDPASQGANYWAVICLTGLFAVMAADMTARTGSLGAAWGLHFMNNVQALLFLTLDGPLSGLSLGSLPISADAPSALPLFAADAFALAAVYVLWRYRHG